MFVTEETITGDTDDDEAVYEFLEGEEEHLIDDDEKKIFPKKEKVQKYAPGATLHLCNFCGYSSPKRYLLSRHMKTHSEDRPYKCLVCDRGFKTKASLHNHTNTHTGTKPHNCKFCESSFTTSGELVRHVRYKHTYEKPHKCTECDYASVELSKLKRHVRCHTGTIYYYTIKRMKINFKLYL